MTDLQIVENNRDIAEIMEKVIAEGDLSKLTSSERVLYYDAICKSLGLNPLTRPFEYIKLNNKLTFYARKDATDQLRDIKKISIIKLETKLIGDIYIVTVYGKCMDGREDIATGAVSIKGLQGDALANAYLKAETKAKRRMTLSISGFGILDESEVDSIPNIVKYEKNIDIQEFDSSDPSFYYNIDDYISEISEAKSMEELKNIFQVSFSRYKDNEEYREKLIKEKDIRKEELMSMNSN